MNDDFIEEFIQFLSPQTLPNLRKSALENLVGLTATTEGQLFFRKHSGLINSTIPLIIEKNDEISESTFKALINLSANDLLAEKLVEANKCELIQNLFEIILRRINNAHVDSACKILNNLSRELNCAHKINEIIEEKKYNFSELITLFCNENYKHDYHYLAGVFCNVSQIMEVRKQLIEIDNNLFKRLIPYMIYLQSDVRREGIAGMIRNCCFDTGVHEILLNDDLELIVYLLLPLTGPEEFDDDEMSLLPLELQYLGDDKKRDSNSNVRKMILEALTQLCATKHGRTILKEKNVYLILRELHKWEKVPSVKLSCENIIQILISDEYDKEYENLKNVDIPDDLLNKFEKMDTAALEDAETEENEIKNDVV